MCVYICLHLQPVHSLIASVESGAVVELLCGALYVACI